MASYLVTATVARSATESAGPALLVASVAVFGSATTGSYIVASLTASAAVAGPVVGAAIDRAHRPRAGFTAAFAILGLGLLVVALTLAHVPVAVTMILAAIAGLGYPALTGAWSAQLPALVSRLSLTRAYGLDAATYSVAAVVAPPAATALVAIAPTAPLWLTLILLAAGVISLRRVPLRPRAQTRESGSMRTDLAAGLGALFGRPALRRSTLITTIGFAGQAAIFVAAPVLALDTGNGLGFTGVILGVFAVGGIATAAWFARRPVQRPDRAIILGTVVSGAALVAVGLAPTTPLLLAAAFVMGASEPPLVSAMFQVRVRESPEHVHAQVFTTAASLRMTAFALATAASGWLLHLSLAWVIGFGLALHVASLFLGLALGPVLPHRRHWVRRG